MVDCNVFEIENGESMRQSPRFKNLFDAIESFKDFTKNDLSNSTIVKVYHHTKVSIQDFNFDNFQRGKDQVSQWGDGLNVSSTTTPFLLKRYGNPIEGEIRDSDFVVIDANKSEKELYEELKAKGYKFNNPAGGEYIENDPAKEYNNTEKANEHPAIKSLFDDFQKSNPQVKGVKVINHIIGNNKLDPFYTIYDAKSFYGPGTLSNKINNSTIKNIKYSLLDNFPDVFTVNSVGDLVVKGDITNPNHTYNVIKSAILSTYKKNIFIESNIGPEYHTLDLSIGKINTDTVAKNNPIANIEFDDIVDNYTSIKPQKVVVEETIKESEYEPNEKFKTSPTLQQQVEHLINSFAEAGIAITVKYDSNLTNKFGEKIKGKVYKESETSATIYLNPSKMSEGTFIHEFSHILIDLLGEDNPLVKQAYNSIKNSNLYNRVKERYPELNEKQLLNETLVTAMELIGAKRHAGKNSLEVAINKIIRAIKNLFGINDNSVELLLDKLFSKRLNSEEFKGEISEEDQESRDIDINYVNLKDLKDQIKEVLQTQLDKLESSIVKNDTDIVLIKANLNALDKITSIEKFTEFIDYLDVVSRDNDSIIKDIKGQDLDSINEDEKHKMLYDLHKVSNRIADIFGGGENSILSQLEFAILEKKSKNESEGKKSEKLTSMEQKLEKITSKLKYQKKYYLDMGAQIHTDLILDYVGPGINTKLDDLIKNIKDGKRVILSAARKHPQYKSTVARYKNKDIKEDEYKELLHQFTLEHIKNKKPSRENILKELRESQTDKSGYSYLMDPLIYSSQVTLQLFTSMVKNKMYQANNDTLDVVNKLAPAYENYKKYKGSDVNPIEFNKDILETHTYYVEDPKTGFRKPMEMLTFVQPYDITAFNNAEYEMRKKLKEKYGTPKYGTEEYKDWRESNKAALYYREVSKWYKENTITLKEGIDKVRELEARLTDIQTKMKEVAPGGAKENADKYALYKAHELELITQRGRLYDSKNKQYKGEAVRPNSKYNNPRFKSLVDIDPITEKMIPKTEAGKYYVSLLEVYHEHQSFCGKQIPTKNSWDKYSYVVPSVEAEGLERVQKDNYNVFKSTKDYFSRSFSFLSTDDSFGAVINANKEQRNKVIPIYYTSATDAKYVSHDVGSTIVLYAGMANLFKRKSEIIGSVMIMRDLLSERELLDKDVSGVPFINSVASKLGVKRFQRKNEESNNFKHFKEFVDSIFFGESELQTQINIAGKTFSANKLVNKLVTHSALNTLALNGLQAANQFLIDELRLGEEAIAAEYFNGTNMTWAKGAYTSAMFSGETITDAGKYRKESKLANFITSFDILGGALGESKRDRTGSLLLKSISTDSLFLLQHMAEHETAVTRGLALADSYRGKLKDKDGNVIKNAEGKDANLYDVYIQDEKTGKWGIDPKVANFKDIHFINLVSGLYKRTNQIKTKIDDPILNRRWYGKALILYRRYFQPGLRRRWGYGDGIHIDTETDTWTEGMYVTFGRYIKESFSKDTRFAFASNYKLLSPQEKANVKRTFAELSFLLSTTVIGAMLISMMDDDDEEDQYVNAFMAYQAKRISSELAQFYNPSEFYRFASSPTALSRPILNSIKLIGQIFDYGLYTIGVSDGEDIFYKRKSGDYEKGDLKLVKTFNDLAPIIRGIEKTTNPEEPLKFFIAPPGVI